MEELQTQEQRPLTKREKRAMAPKRNDNATVPEQGLAMSKAVNESNEFVSVRKEALDNLIARLDKLESRGSDEVITDTTGHEIARMRTYREDGRDVPKLVIDWKNIRSEKTLEGRFLIYELTLLDRDGEKSKAEMRLENFLRDTELTTVTILDKQTEQKKRTEGTVTKMEVEGYSMVPRGRVPNVITWTETFCKIRTEWGQELTINANRLNQ